MRQGGAGIPFGQCVNFRLSNLPKMAGIRGLPVARDFTEICNSCPMELKISTRFPIDSRETNDSFQEQERDLPASANELERKNDSRYTTAATHARYKITKNLR